MNAFAFVLFCAAAAPNAWAARNARHLTGTTFEQLAKLTAADAAAGDGFGRSVAIDGDTVVIGAFQYYNDGPGVVYVFRTTDGGATYDQVAKLTAADGASGDASAPSWPSTATPSWSGL